MVGRMGAIIRSLTVITGNNAYMRLLSERFRIIHDTSGKSSVPRTRTAVENDVVFQHIIRDTVMTFKLSGTTREFPATGVLIPFPNLLYAARTVALRNEVCTIR